MKDVIFFFALIIVPAMAFGLNGNGSPADPYDGNLTANTTFGPGDIYIDGDIRTGAYRLTIAPETTLRIYDGVIIYAESNGSIIADGSQAAPIVFTAFGTGWGHIYMAGSLPSVFDYCLMEKGMPSLSQQGGSGGTIFANNCGALQITNCTFRDNIASHLGGALDITRCNANILNSVFQNNVALERGGAIEIGELSVVVIDSCRIYSNRSVVTSGAIHFGQSPTVTIRNTLIYDNTCDAPNTGALTPGAATGYTGPVRVNIINCVLANNSPGDLVLRTTATTSVKNTIIWGSGVSVRYIYEAPMTDNLINCAVQNVVAMNGSGIDIEGTYTNSFTLNSSNLAETGPNFTDPIAGDFRIGFASPCRDKGTDEGIPSPPGTDFLGNGRIGPYDIGAYEVQYSRWKGETSNSWVLAANWESDLLPSSSGDNIMIPAATYYPVCDNLEIAASGSLTIEPGGSLTVNGNLVNEGLFTINSLSTDLSGSLIVKGESSGAVTFNRFLRPEGHRGDRHFFSSPVSGLTVSDFISDNSPKVSQLWEWYEWDGDWPTVTSSYGPFIEGKGYNIDQTTGSDGLLTFRGEVINEASIPVTSPYIEFYIDRSSPEAYGVGNEEAPIWTPGRSWDVYGGGGWNLLGNPFTSAMDAGIFISTNSGSFDPNYKALYVYDGVTNEYLYAAADIPGYAGGELFGDKIQAGQGFFVLALHDNLDFGFTPVMQVHNTTVPMLKSAGPGESWPGLQLKVKKGVQERMTTIVFHDEMTKGLDPGYDVGQYSTGPAVEIYTALAEKDNSVNFARQALPLTECQKIIVPVGIDSENGGEVIFSADVVPLRNFKFWLEDRITGLLTNLNTENYKVVLPARTYGTGRFYIHISASRALRQRPVHPGNTDIRIWSSSDGKLNIQGFLRDGTLCEVFDTFGRKVYENRLCEGDYNTFTMHQSLKGIYLVTITDGVIRTTRKVVL